MFKRVFFLAGLCLVLATGLALAEGIEGGFSGAVGIPTGDFSDIADPGFTGRGWVGYPINNSLLVSAAVGFSTFSLTEDITGGELDFTTTMFPVTVGIVKYWGESQRFYTGPSIGAYFVKLEVDTPIGTFESDTEAKFGFGPRIGYLFNVGSVDIDVAAEYHTLFADVEDQDGDEILLSYFGIGVGVVFGHTEAN
jgi:hypothetical protein